MPVKIFKAPFTSEVGDMSLRVFLAGSIDTGNAVDWQTQVSEAIQTYDANINIYNPRRDDFDATLVQDISNPIFKEQVVWELEHIEGSDLIVVYFDPNGKAPITLMELGLMSQMGADVIVACPEGFWRRGNVQIMCERYNIPLENSLEDLIDRMDDYLSGYGHRNTNS